MSNVVVGTFYKEKKMLRRVLQILFWLIVIAATIGDIAIARYCHLTF
jgi:hypothetical protein